jgi:hypothetical protein
MMHTLRERSAKWGGSEIHLIGEMLGSDVSRRIDYRRTAVVNRKALPEQISTPFAVSAEVRLTSLTEPTLRESFGYCANRGVATTPRIWVTLPFELQVECEAAHGQKKRKARCITQEEITEEVKESYSEDCDAHPSRYHS